MKVTWLGHSAFRIETGKSVILIDPFLTGNRTFEAAKIGVGAASQERPTFSSPTAMATMSATRCHWRNQTGATVVTNYDLCMYLAKQGVTTFDPMNTGGTIDQGDFKVTLVRADHSAGLVEMDVNFPLGSANGIVVTPRSGPTLLHMGDTDIFSDMGLINEIYAPERWHRADRRPLHDGRAHGGVGVPELLLVQHHLPGALRHVRHYRPNGRQVRC